MGLNRGVCAWNVVARHSAQGGYSNGPVRDVINGAKNAIKGLITGGTNPTGGDKR